MLIRSVLFNFQGAFLNSVFLISQTTLLLYHIFSSLSRGFSNFFQSFFSNHLGSFKRSDFLFESFYIISHCLSFVKRFSKLFSKFFVTFSLSLCPHLECLSIISPSPAKVNTFLKSFFHSLLMSYIFNCFSTIHSNMHCFTPFLHSFTYFTRAFSQTTNSFLYIFTQILVNL